MEYYEVDKLNAWYFNIKLPLSEVRRVSYNSRELTYLYGIHRYVYQNVDRYLYESEPEEGVYTFQSGYASLIYNEFYDDMSDYSRELLESYIFPTYDLKVNFDNLYDYQNEDLNRLLLVKRGLFQTYTGYGKSEVIVTLANYIVNELGQKVLLVTASSVSMMELTNRFKSKFGIELGQFNPGNAINIINIKGFLRSYAYDKNDDYWNSKFWILADEVENCCSTTAMDFYETLPNVIRMYGFSATSDKQYAEPLLSRIPDEFYKSDEVKRLNNLNRFDGRSKLLELKKNYIYEIRTRLGRNKYLVGYFGNSVVYRKPRNFDIKLINVMSSISDDDIVLDSSYQYDNVVVELFTNEKMCKLIQLIAYKVGTIFIPMFRLQVIDYWLEHYFQLNGYITVVICSRGFELYDGGKYQDNITIEELKLLVKLGVVNLILGTKSSYNALDLPELHRSLLLYSKAANVVIQAIGRTARGNKFEVYSIKPYKRIPMYSKDLDMRLELIKNYYSDCNIVDVKCNENEY